MKKIFFVVIISIFILTSCRNDADEKNDAESDNVEYSRENPAVQRKLYIEYATSLNYRDVIDSANIIVEGEYTGFLESVNMETHASEDDSRYTEGKVYKFKVDKYLYGSGDNEIKIALTYKHGDFLDDYYYEPELNKKIVLNLDYYKGQGRYRPSTYPYEFTVEKSGMLKMKTNRETLSKVFEEKNINYEYFIAAIDEIKNDFTKKSPEELSEKYGFSNAVVLSRGENNFRKILLYNRDMDSEEKLKGLILNVGKKLSKKEITFDKSLISDSVDFWQNDYSFDNYLIARTVNYDKDNKKMNSKLLYARKNDRDLEKPFAVHDVYEFDYDPEIGMVPQSEIPAIIEWTIDLVGKHLIYQDVDENWKITDLSENIQYVNTENLDFSDFKIEIMDLMGGHVYLLQSRETGEVLAFNLMTKKFEIVENMALNYKNEGLGFGINFPENWLGRYVIEEHADWILIKTFVKDKYENRGELLYIRKSEKTSDGKNKGMFENLYEDDEFIYTLSAPLDITMNITEEPSVGKEFMSLIKEMKKIYDWFYILEKKENKNTGTENNDELNTYKAFRKEDYLIHDEDIAIDMHFVDWVTPYHPVYYSIPGNIINKDIYVQWKAQFEKNKRNPYECNIENVIKEFDIPKEDFIKNNGDIYTEAQIDALYSDNRKQINETFVNPAALLIDGHIYTLGWLNENSIAEYKEAGITYQILEEYLKRIEDVPIREAYEKIETTKLLLKSMKSGKPHFDYWIESPLDPIVTVKRTLENLINKDYTFKLYIDEIAVDEDETSRVAKMYSGTDWAVKRNLTEEDLKQKFIVVNAKYYAEYDHSKTYLNDGYLEQNFYLLKDEESGEWNIIDKTSPSRLEIY